MVGSTLVNIYEGNKAASAERNAAANANAQQMNMFNIAEKNLQPFIQTGTNAANELNMAPSDMNAFVQHTPGYQFNLNQGERAVQNAASARGLGVSGAALRGAADYASGLASSTYQNQFSNLLNTATLGANAGASVGSNAVRTGSEIGANTIGAGNATAAGDLNTAKAINNFSQGTANALLQGALLSQGIYAH